jgi:AcrR family transcriptional regulator
MNTAKERQVSVGKEVISEVEVPKTRVRDRIFETACDLFYRHGIRAVGVDAIATEAGTNKMSFYRSFPSKDQLVAEYLREQEREGWEWWDSLVNQHPGDARAQIEALFDAHVEKTCCEDGGEFRGCAIANAAVEITDPVHPARAVVEEYKAEMRLRFRKLAQDVGARDYACLGDSLMLLFEGSYLTRLTFRHSGPAECAAKAARVLVAAHTG